MSYIHVHRLCKETTQKTGETTITIMYMMILLSLLLSRCWWFWFYKLAYLKEINHENRFCLLPFFCCFILADVIWQWSFILCRVCLNSRLVDQSVGRSTRLVSSWSAFAHVGYHKIIDCKWMRMRKTFTNTHLLSLEDICNKANFFILFFMKYKKENLFRVVLYHHHLWYRYIHPPLL